MMSLRPSLYLSDLYGADCTLLARPHPSPYGYVPGNLREWDGRTSSAMVIAGAMPFHCPTDLLAPRVQALHHEAGLCVGARPVPYGSLDELATRLAAGPYTPRSLVANYTQPPGAIPDAAYRVARPILVSLNNKADFARWIEGFPAPPRQVVPLREALQTPASFFPRGVPTYVKAVTDAPCGGGAGIRVVRGAQAFRKEAALFSPCREVIVEPARPYDTTFCLNYAIGGPNAVTCLGAGEQIVEDERCHAGNWFDPDNPPPPAAVEAGAEVARRAARGGYVGIAGMDVGRLPDGSFEFLDLNFRLNASTIPLLFLPSIRESLGYDPVARLFAARPAGLSDRVLAVVRRAIARQHAFLLGAYESNPPGAVASRLRLLVVGRRRAIVERRFRLLQAALSAA